jgi:alkanesulfonate monooxygenase SsuD/methylene tetrahydromethanopterin reductase-like flavin-dependent oxidoreductase (luciferase family)
MRFGIFDQSEQPGGLTPTELYASRLALVERADQLGFWGYHKSEHHMIPLDHAPSIGLFLSAAAQRTERIRICSLVHLLPFYHPIRLYEEVCMLDHLSGGRFELGFGKGISPPEHLLWGLDPEEADDRTEETLDLLLSALQCTDGLFGYEGRFHRLADVPLELGPLQKPFPPLWRPGKVPAAASRGVSTVVGGPTPLVHASIEQYHQLYQPVLSGGREPTVGAIRKFVVAPTDAEADAIGRRSWSTFTDNLTVLFRRYGLAPPNDPTVGGDYDRAKELSAIVAGSPGTVRGHVDELAGDGLVDYVIGGFAFGDLSHAEALRSIELFAEHVVAPLSDPTEPVPA